MLNVDYQKQQFNSIIYYWTELLCVETTTKIKILKTIYYMDDSAWVAMKGVVSCDKLGVGAYTFWTQDSWIGLPNHSQDEGVTWGTETS